MKKILCLIIALSLGLSITGCTKNKSEDAQGNNTTTKEEPATDKGSTNDSSKKDDPKTSAEIVTTLVQFETPKVGEDIAVFETSLGKIKFKLFPKEAPKTVENLTKLINKKYYDGITFHRVINGFMIQGGDPTGTGAGGESAFGKTFEDELTPKLHNFRGALSMANAGANTNGSQFFVVQAKKVDEPFITAMKDAGEENYSNSVIAKYSEVGGTPGLDYKHTVFGQVIEGMDVVDKIAAVETIDPGKNDKPKKDVKIIKAYIEKYAK